MKKSCSLFLAMLLFSGLASAAALKVGLVLDKGGKDDKSFNSAAYAGLERAKKEFGIAMKYVEATDDNSFEPMLRSFAHKDFDLIIAIGFGQLDAIKKVAPQFPQKRFLLVDAEASGANIKSAVFQDHEGSYLVGALAALSSPSLKFGFIGGMDAPLIRRFEKGYEAGVKKIKPKAQVIVNYVGVTGDAWNNPAKAKELASSQYTGGIDVIYTSAGASNSGVFDAAEEFRKKAIGCDSNQNGLKPGVILTSMLKRVDVAVYETVKEMKDGGFQAGTKSFGLSDSGVDYALDAHNDKLVTAPMRKKLEDLKAQIIAGKIQVPDYYKMKPAQAK